MPPSLTPQRAALLASTLGSSMAFLDGTVVNLALPVMQRGFRASQGDVQWVAEAYLLTLSALLLVGGGLADRFGTRRIFALGIVLFTLASLGCAVAPELHVVILLRAIQGVGGALLTPTSLALISGAYEGSARGRAIGTWSAFSAIAGAVGPVVGGFLIAHASWRWAFALNLPLAIVVLILLPRAPPLAILGARGRLDWPGALLVTAALGSCIQGLTELQAGSRLALPLLVAAAVLGSAFLLVEQHTANPMVPLDLFRTRDFAITNVLTLFLYAALGGLTFFLPFLLLGAHGYSPQAAGAAGLPLIALIFLMSRWAGALADRRGARLPLTVGPALAGLGATALALRAHDPHYATGALPGMVLIGLGLGLTVAPLTTAVMGSVATEHGGMASAINNAAARAAGLLAIPFFGFLGGLGFRAALGRELPATGLSAEAQATLLAEAGRALGLRDSAEIPAGLKLTVDAAIRHAYATGFQWVAAGVATLCLLAALSGFRYVPEEKKPTPA